MTTIALNEKTVLTKPEAVPIGSNGFHSLLDPEAPNWIAMDARGKTILSWVDGTSTFADLVQRYAAAFGQDGVKAWLEVHTFVQDALRMEFLKVQNGAVPEVAVYGGRKGVVVPALEELWIHTNNSCNLTCAHCLVNSSPQGERGLPTQSLKKIIHEAAALGVKRFYFTGGEPFVRKDIFELIDTVLTTSELIILTNGILLQDKIKEQLRTYDPKKLKLQISLDGPTAKLNDPIRGEGSFEKILAGVRSAVELGLLTSVTMTVTRSNLSALDQMPALLKSLGAANLHLLWPHKRGRALEADHHEVTIPELIAALKKLKVAARAQHISVDNFGEFVARVNDLRGYKKDLSGAGVKSVCVYADGWVYPSAAMANVLELRCGNALEQSLDAILKTSEVTQAFQATTLAEKSICKTCPWKFICGGGDVEHGYFYSDASTLPEKLRGHDPYCEVYQYLLNEAVDDVVAERGLPPQERSGFTAPVVFHGMGEDAVVCGVSQNGYGEKDLPTVQTVHSNCVLTFDLDRSRQAVRAFYGKAAEEPQAELCCPTNAYERDDLSHIPQEVIDRFYGCGGPMTIAGVAAGESVLDLGSGGGIDCFIAAKKVGASGKVYGVDMTDPMLKVANENNRLIIDRLGYDVVQFKKGFLEAIPLADRTVNLVTSNCVINLSPDKRAVFREMWRVLDDHGRIVLSDVVSEVEPPPYLKVNESLWGECISGALTEAKFITYLEQAGFYGLQILKKNFWKEVEGYRFYSLIVRGYKFEKKAGCVYQGQTAIYLGPYKGVADEEGHFFPRHVPVEVCTDTAAKLSHPPYQGMFAVIEPNQVGQGIPLPQIGCDPTTGCC